jgi:hypothetical protein
MKLQHTAAVLALAGWYLITPPSQTNGHFDTSAPLSEWRIQSGFGTGDDCKKTVAELSSKAMKEGKSGDADELKASQCVATDDPRLKGNL